MREYVVNRPDEAAMRRILEAEPASPEGVVLRLAWQQGLSRDEISDLTWEQVSFLDDRLELPDRMIPLEAEVRSCLWRLFQAHSEVSPYVVLSSRDRTPLRPESISRLARQALDREGQTSVRLMDLRHDWIIRQLADKDWPAVARISAARVIRDRRGRSTGLRECSVSRTWGSPAGARRRVSSKRRRRALVSGTSRSGRRRLPLSKST